MRCGNDEITKKMSEAVCTNNIILDANIHSEAVNLSLLVHLTFTNACAQNINDMLLKTEIRRRRDLIWYSKSTNGIGRSTSFKCIPSDVIVMTRGTPVRLSTTSDYGCRNSVVRITSFTVDRIQLQYIGGELKWFALCPFFFSIAHVSYALTIHKAQGMTLSERYQVHEMGRIKSQKNGPRLLYVAFTRCTKPKNFSLCKDCKCQKFTGRILSNRLICT